MKKRTAWSIYVFVCMILLLCGSITVHAKGVYEEPGSISSSHNWANPVKCHTFTDENGNITIMYSVWSGSQQTLRINSYSPKGDRISRKEIPVPGETWGGTVFFGDDGCRYLTTGNDGQNAFYIQKYSADWALLGTASIGYDESYTYEAFRGGNSDMAMAGKYLIVHAARGRQDGHQSNTTFYIDTETMTPTYVAGPFGFSHVSHSFNQFVRVDQDQMIFVDHGDAYPRSVHLQAYRIAADESGLEQELESELDLLTIKGSIGDNKTGVTVDGFELGKDSHIVAGTAIPHDRFASETEFENYEGSNNIYIALVGKDFKSSQWKWMTAFPDSSDIRIKNLNLLKVNEDRFLLLYGIYKDDKPTGTCYMMIDSSGNILKQGEKAKPFYCTSAPSVYQDTLIWCHYVESELGSFLVLNRWNTGTGELSIQNLSTGQKSKIDKVQLESLADTVSAGKKYEITALVYSSVFAEEFPTAPVVWSSSNPDILEIMEEESILGDAVWNRSYKKTCTTIKAKSSGTVTVTMSIGDKKCSGKITVAAPVKKLSLSKKKLTLKTGQSDQLHVSGNNGNAVSWTSSDRKVAKVSSKGKVTGLKKGQAKITVSALGKKASVTVKVSAKKWTPPTPSITSVERKSGNQLSIKWKPVNDVSGYEIYLSYQKKRGYQKVKTVSRAKTVSCSVKKVKTKTCYVRIRSYKKFGSGKLYGKYSKAVVCR